MPVLEILIVLALARPNGYFAMSGAGRGVGRPARLEARARKGAAGAPGAGGAREPGRMLSTVQIGITLVGIVAGAFGAARLAELLAGGALAAGRGSRRRGRLHAGGPRDHLPLADHRRARAQAPGTARARAHRRSGGVDGRPPVPRHTPAVWLLDRSSRLVLRLLGSEARRVLW